MERPMEERFADIRAAYGEKLPAPELSGVTKRGRKLPLYRLGTGPARISLIAGAHADEPVGPILLHSLLAYLEALPTADPMLSRFEWWIVPDINPDGSAENSRWSEGIAKLSVARYLGSVVREPPGDDLEFGFPRDPADTGARPESRAVFEWWRSSDTPFTFHASLHGMAFAAGPWLLIDPAWVDASAPLQDAFARRVDDLGYSLHDVERYGEKGFVRIARGFATRPNSKAMAEYFLKRGDPQTAALFRPSSMETMVSLGGAPLTIVTEMPLFITPGVGERLGPPDPVAEEWQQLIQSWRERLKEGEEERVIEHEAVDAGLEVMPLEHQLLLQWTAIASGISLAQKALARG